MWLKCSSSRCWFQDTVSVHRPSFYAQRFQDFMAKTVFRKIPSRKFTLPTPNKYSMGHLWCLFNFIFLFVSLISSWVWLVESQNKNLILSWARITNLLVYCISLKKLFPRRQKRKSFFSITMWWRNSLINFYVLL